MAISTAPVAAVSPALAPVGWKGDVQVWIRYAGGAQSQQVRAAECVGIVHGIRVLVLRFNGRVCGVAYAYETPGGRDGIDIQVATAVGKSAKAAAGYLRGLEIEAAKMLAQGVDLSRAYAIGRLAHEGQYRR